MKRRLEELHEPSVEPLKSDNPPLCANCGELLLQLPKTYRFLTSVQGASETWSGIAFCCQECKYYYLLEHSLQYPYGMTLERAREKSELSVESILHTVAPKRYGMKLRHKPPHKCVTCLRSFPWPPIQPSEFEASESDWTWCSKMCAARYFETHLEQRNLRQLESYCLSKGQPMGLRHHPDDLASGKISYDTFLRETVQRRSGLGPGYRTVIIDRPDIPPTLFEEEEEKKTETTEKPQKPENP